jgi:hypothetical protein
MVSLKKKILSVFFIVLINTFVAQVNSLVFENAKTGLNANDIKVLDRAKIKFEQELYKNGIPSGWAFVLENNEIKSITNHSNHGYRKVASQKDQMIKNIRAVFNS